MPSLKPYILVVIVENLLRDTELQYGEYDHQHALLSNSPFVQYLVELH